MPGTWTRFIGGVRRCCRQVCELEDLPLATATAIEIEAFVPLESVNPLKIGEGYYLQPSGQVADKPYELLGLLRVREGVLVPHAMCRPDEVRSPEELYSPAVDVDEEEIEGALALMETMTRDDLEGPDFRDEYTETMQDHRRTTQSRAPAGGAGAPSSRPRRSP